MRLYSILQVGMQKIPYMLVVGKKEVEENTVSVRERGSEKQVSQMLSQLKRQFRLPFKLRTR